MKNILIAVIILFTTSLFAQQKELKSGNILFHAIAKKEVTASTNTFKSIIDLEQKTISFTVPIQSFQFKNKLMKKHFNNAENMNSEKFPNATFKGTILANTNIAEEGRHIVTVKGEMTIKGETHPFTANGLLVNRHGITTVEAVFLVNGLEFGLTNETIKKFADKIEVTLEAIY